VKNIEPIRCIWYGEGGFHPLHHDSLIDGEEVNNERRMVSIIYYLSTPSTGGETVFETEDGQTIQVIKAEVGKVVTFANYDQEGKARKESYHKGMIY
jgi:hypothetical protein